MNTESFPLKGFESSIALKVDTFVVFRRSPFPGLFKKLMVAGACIKHVRFRVVCNKLGMFCNWRAPQHKLLRVGVELVKTLPICLPWCIKWMLSSHSQDHWDSLSLRDVSRSRVKGRWNGIYEFVGLAKERNDFCLTFSNNFRVCALCDVDRWHITENNDAHIDLNRLGSLKSSPLLMTGSVRFTPCVRGCHPPLPITPTATPSATVV